MTRRPGGGSTAVRLALAAVSFACALLALRTAVRHLIAAMVAWVIGGLFFVTGTFLVLSTSWRAVRNRLRRRPRPQP